MYWRVACGFPNKLRFVNVSMSDHEAGLAPGACAGLLLAAEEAMPSCAPKAPGRPKGKAKSGATKPSRKTKSKATGRSAKAKAKAKAASKPKPSNPRGKAKAKPTPAPKPKAKNENTSQPTSSSVNNRKSNAYNKAKYAHKKAGYSHEEACAAGRAAGYSDVLLLCSMVVYSFF